MCGAHMVRRLQPEWKCTEGRGRKRTPNLQIHLLQERTCHRVQGFAWPFSKPIDRATVHQGGEHTQARSQSIAHGAHAKHNVQVRSTPFHKVVVQGRLVTRKNGEEEWKEENTMVKKTHSLFNSQPPWRKTTNATQEIHWTPKSNASLT